MPIVIFGTKSIIRDKEETDNTFSRCSQCQQTLTFRKANRWTLLSLFWIPLIPIWRTQVLRCPNCGAIYK